MSIMKISSKVDIEDQYYNMAEKIEPHPYIIDIPKKCSMI